jgi:hypothetical protein
LKWPLTWRVPSCVQVASKLDPADKETIEKAVDETVEWLDSNQLAEVRLAFRATSSQCACSKVHVCV